MQRYKDRNFTRNSLEKFIRAADERLDEYLRCLDEGDVTEAGTGGARTKNLAEKIEALRKKRGRYGAMLAELERTGESQISLTDPDSRAMAAHTKAGVGYNIQIAVDAKNKMIVEQAVTNQVVDMGLLKETAEPARAILDIENIDVVADRGYFKSEDIEACEKAGLTPYVPKPQRGSSVRNGFFRKDEFRYDPDQDVYICPAGETLSPNPGFEKDRLQQSGGMPFLSSSVALHHRPSPGLASGERGGAGPHGRPPEGEALVPRQRARCYQRDDIVGCGLLTEIHGKIFVDEGRRLERRTARKPNEVGAAETIETFAVAQQHVEDAVLGERAAAVNQSVVRIPTPWKVKADLQARLAECRLELHPTKTKIVYCKGREPAEQFVASGILHPTGPKAVSEEVKFDVRILTTRQRRFTFVRLHFAPIRRTCQSCRSARSATALKAMRTTIRDLKLRSRTDVSLADIARKISVV